MLNETYLGSNFKKSDYGVLDRFDPYSRHSRFAFRLDNAIRVCFNETRLVCARRKPNFDVSRCRGVAAMHPLTYFSCDCKMKPSPPRFGAAFYLRKRVVLTARFGGAGRDPLRSSSSREDSPRIKSCQPGDAFRKAIRSRIPQFLLANRW